MDGFLYGEYMNTHNKLHIGSIILAAIVLIVLGAAPVYPAYEETLVGYWKMDEAGSNITPDATDNANDGSVVGATLIDQGKFGKAFSFDGNDYIDVGDPVSGVLDFAQPGATISYWVQFNSLPANQSANATVSKATYDPSLHWDGYMIETWGTRSVLSVGNDPAGNYGSLWSLDSSLQTGTWINITNVWESDGYFTVYIDGEEAEASYVQSLPWTTGAENDTSLMFGRHPDSSYPRYLSGYLDDVAIWSRALSSAEAERVFQVGVEQFQQEQGGVPEPATVAGIVLIIVAAGLRRLRKR